MDWDLFVKIYEMFRGIIDAAIDFFGKAYDIIFD